MKKLVIIIFLLTIMSTLYAEDQRYFNIGVSFAAGGRYDEVRMCIASRAGFMGGPAFEFSGFVFEYRFNSFFGLGAYIPVSRPLMFSTGFQMLQFMPECILNFHIPLHEKAEFIINPGLGASFHYGPDYRSGIMLGETRGSPFFAAGPRVSVLVGTQINVHRNIALIIGVKPYFSYLFASSIRGVVAGGEIDFQFRYIFR